MATNTNDPVRDGTAGDNEFLIEGFTGDLSPKIQRTKIVKALQKYFPNKIDKAIFHFPQNWFYFVTDKDFFFAIKRRDREQTEEETKKLEELRTNAFDLRRILKSGKEVEQAEQEFEKYLFEVEAACSADALFYICERKLEKQVRVYLSKTGKEEVERKGYTVEEYEMNQTAKRWNEHFLNYDFYQTKRKGQFVRLTASVFVAACKGGVLPPKGFTTDANGLQIELKRGVKKGVSNDHLKQSLRLIEVATGEELKFESHADAAKNFKMPKSNFARTMKGKNNGDKVKIKKRLFVVFHDNFIQGRTTEETNETKK